MSGALSQEEIDALREAVKTGDVLDETEAEETPEQPVDEKEQIKVADYDFRKPRILSVTQLQSLQLRHEAFAKHLQSSLFTRLKTNIETNLVAVDQLIYSEFVLSSANPTYLAVVDTEPDMGCFAMEISLSIVLPIIDMLLGGDGSASTDPRELTYLEAEIFKEFIGVCISELPVAWGSIPDFGFKLGRQEFNPEYFNMTTPETSCLNMTLDVHIGEISGVWNLCYPFSLIQAIMNKEEGQDGKKPGSVGFDTNNNTLKAMDIVPLDVSAIIGRCQVSAQELGMLKHGDVLCLDSRVDAPIDLYIGKNLSFKAEVGKRKRNVAVAITEPYSMNIGNPS